MTDHRGATMRARWYALEDWWTVDAWPKIRAAIRQVAPPSGQQYELFDCALFVLVIVGTSYVLEDPSPASAQALGWFAQATSLTLWGSLLSLAAIFAALAAYHPKRLDLGYTVLITGCLFWCLAFLIGIVFYDGSPRSLVSVVIYGWVVRRLIAVRLGGR